MDEQVNDLVRTILAGLPPDYIRVIRYCPAIERMCNCEVWLMFPETPERPCFSVRARELRKPLNINEYNWWSSRSGERIERATLGYSPRRWPGIAVE